jgi:glycosyltransferase involved in cell wall biosynthesis
MRLAILSDTRLPTDINYPGHGLGRAIYRLAWALERRGHDVTVYAGPGSRVPGCQMVIHQDEDQRALSMATRAMDYDAYLDGSHHFEFAKLRDDLPIVCKVVDAEGHAPRNRVYGCKNHPARFGDPDGMVIPEGLDITTLPFYDGVRGKHLVCVGLLSASWKRFDLVSETAINAGRPLWLIGSEGPAPVSADKQLQIEDRLLFFDTLAHAGAVISAVPATSFLEGAACGTPSLGLTDDGMIEDGITGFVRDTPGELAECCNHLKEIDPKRARAWIAECRSADGMAAQYEKLFERVANGERW